MEVCIFRNSKYAKLAKHIFIYDQTWESFRPIQKIGWDGNRFVTDDFLFKKNIFDPFYGFGSAEMKTLCESLVEMGEPVVIDDPVTFWKWCGTTDAKWFKDRAVVFAKTCSNLDWRKYLSYIGSKHRTLRNPPRGRLTRRLVRK
jgi:hypothetical protein